MVCSTLLWIGGAVSVAGTVRYEDEMGERDKDVISDKLATCLEGCQLARAAGGIAIVGGLVATLLQAFCAKSGDSGEQQTVSAPPMNDSSAKIPRRSTTAFAVNLSTIRRHEKQEPEAPAAEAEEAVERPPGFARKLSSFLFGEQEPVEGVVVSIEPPSE